MATTGDIPASQNHPIMVWNKAVPNSAAAYGLGGQLGRVVSVRRVTTA